MPRPVDTALWDRAAKHYAAEFLRPTRLSPTGSGRPVAGREYVLTDLYNLTYKDAHEYIVQKVKGYLGPDAVAEFEEEAKKRFTPRSDETFKQLLAEKLAIDPDGNHVPGKVGTVEVGRRVVAKRMVRGRIKDATWPVYAGEEEERAAGSDKVDPFPPREKVFVGDEHLKPVPKGGW